MAGFDDFPLVTPAPQPGAADPWSAFPVEQPAQAVAPPVPAAPPAAAAGAAPNRIMIHPEAPPAAAPADTSIVDTIMNGANYAAGSAAVTADGILRGVTNLLGLPVDAVNAAPMLANLLPGVDGVGPISDNPFGGSKSLYSAARLGGLFGPPPQPQDFTQRLLSRVGEEVGAAAVPGMGAVGVGGRMGVDAVRKSGPLARMFLEPAAVNPSQFLRKEGTIAAGAGLGAGLTNEVTGNQDRSNPWIDAGGAIGGAAATGISSGFLGGLRNVLDAFAGNGAYQDDVVREVVASRLADAAGIPAKPGEAPDLAALIAATENGNRVADVIPGFSDSLADRTRNPGLAALEYSRQSGPNAGVYTQARANNTAAIDRAMAPLEPTEQPGAFSSALATERDKRVTAAAGATSAAQQMFDEAVRPLQPVMTGEARGADIRAALENASDAAKAVVSAAWRPVDQAGAQVDIAPLQQEFGQIAGATPEALRPLLPAANTVPDRLVTPATETTPAITAQPLSEVMGIRSALTNDLRRDITPQERNLIEQHIQRLDSYLDANVPPDLRAQYDAARAATRDYNDRFTRPQTAIAQTMREREGQYALPDSAVAPKFVQSDQGRIADFEAMMREAGSDQRVQTAVRDQILQDVKDRGLLQDEKALRGYLDQYGTVFNRFPALRDQLGTAAKLRTQLDETAAVGKSLTETLTKQGRGAVANYLSYADENADRAMKGVLASREPAKAIDELLTFVGDDPKAVEGARKVFWNIMQEKSRAGGRTTAGMDGRQPWSPRALADFLSDPVNAAVAQRLYRDKPEHLGRVAVIAEALSGVDLRNAAKAPNTSGTTQGMSQLLTPEALQSRLYAYMSGRISGTFLVTSIASVIMRRQIRAAQSAGIEKMLDDILNNADTAALFMRENNPANRAALLRKAKGWFGNEASNIINAMSAEDRDETTDAVMGNGR
jgi:hypothetical protein